MVLIPISYGQCENWDVRYQQGSSTRLPEWAGHSFVLVTIASLHLGHCRHVWDTHLGILVIVDLFPPSLTVQMCERQALCQTGKTFITPEAFGSVVTYVIIYKNNAREVAHW